MGIPIKYSLLIFQQLYMNLLYRNFSVKMINA